VNPIEAQQEIYEMKEGDNIAARLKKINVYDLKNKKKNLHTLLAGKDSLLIMVKPGCIFCESMLAVMNTVKPIVRPSLFIALEGSHTTQEQFKEKYKKNSALKATWIYDQDGKLNSELGLVSFPRLVYINKNLEVVRNQVGLVVPANKEKLENEPFPVILQKLSEETIAWMQSL
jgi:thioredoxin-related protein